MDNAKGKCPASIPAAKRTLASGARNCYSRVMLGELGRRILVALLSVALVTGFAFHSVQAADTSVGGATAKTVSANVATPAGDHGCAGDHKAAPRGICNVLCASAVALPSITFRFDALLVGTMGPTADSAVIDHIVPPDTHPPKSLDLS
jgi:hypothetical protein